LRCQIDYSVFKMKKKIGNFRYIIIIFVIFGATGCVLVRLFYLQVLNHNFYSALAEGQHGFNEKIIPQRGEIFIQEKGGIWHPLATNRNWQAVFLVPKEVTEKNEVAQKVGPLLGIPEEKILDKLKNPDDLYEPLQSKVNDDLVKKIKDLNLSGVYTIPDGWRWYPQGTLASHILGFVGIKDNQRVGQYGLEEYFEQELKGRSGFMESQKDALGRSLLVNNYSFEPAQNGDNLYLTLDQNVQYTVQNKLKSVLEKWHASGGCAIVMEPKSGAIRAMVSFPDFDPNEYNKVENIDVFLNSCTQKLYEPGSVFKPITMAAGLDTNIINPETTYVDTGSVKIGEYTIANAQGKIYGLSSMTNVLEKSINTGAIFVERQIGGDTFRKYIEAFGFDKPLGIDLEGEVSGNLKNIDEKYEINFATASFGQGISVTPLEMAFSIGAIANSGKLMQPYIVEKIVDANGKEQITQPKMIRQVISSATAGKLTAMLVSTVLNGYDKIKIDDYFVAGKTGTAQIPNKDKRGYSEETNHTFAGYAPAYNPKFLIFLSIEKPQGIEFASESLAPVFSELAQYLFNYYNIPPDR